MTFSKSDILKTTTVNSTFILHFLIGGVKITIKCCMNIIMCFVIKKPILLKLLSFSHTYWA